MYALTVWTNTRSDGKLVWCERGATLTLVPMKKVWRRGTDGGVMEAGASAEDYHIVCAKLEPPFIGNEQTPPASPAVGYSGENDGPLNSLDTVDRALKVALEKFEEYGRSPMVSPEKRNWPPSPELSELEPVTKEEEDDGGQERSLKPQSWRTLSGFFPRATKGSKHKVAAANQENQAHN